MKLVQIILDGVVGLASYAALRGFGAEGEWPVWVAIGVCAIFAETLELKKK